MAGCLLAMFILVHGLPQRNFIGGVKNFYWFLLLICVKKPNFPLFMGFSVERFSMGLRFTKVVNLLS
jgi:hypothetical protein